MDELEIIVDPDSRNLTFTNAQTMVTKAQQWLAPAHSARISSLDDHDRRLYDTAKAIRDFVAHQSDASKALMNQRLASIELAGTNRGLGRGGNLVHNVGAFLKSSAPIEPRVVLYIRRLNDLATKM
jgi:hypothetical protein